MILVEMDSVAIRWVRQETLLGATFKKKEEEEEEGIAFIVNFLDTSVAKLLAASFSLVRITAQKTIDSLHQHQSENIKSKLFVSWFINNDLQTNNR
jgi:hypothetical protein